MDLISYHHTIMKKLLFVTIAIFLALGAFADAVRHGGAANIRIAGKIHTGALNISVRDDGCGFDTSTRPGQTEGHFGLDGIIERIERLGGTFKIESSPGRGTYAVMSFSKTPRARRRRIAAENNSPIQRRKIGRSGGI